MKLLFLLINLSFFTVVGNLYGQTNQADKLRIPFLDKESQSNVLATVLGEQPCPLEFTNTLSNTNLFTLEQQNTIRKVFSKYKNTSTNYGPSGTVQTGLYKTNFLIRTEKGAADVETWVASFEYTNFEAHEEIRFGGGFSAKFRNGTNDGYNVFFTRTGNGTLLSFGEVKQNLISGLFVRFEDNHPQGMTWDYRLANFDGNHLEEYRYYTNRMICGKFFMWNPRNNNLMLKAEFKVPYDFEKHRTDSQILHKGVIKGS